MRRAGRKKNQKEEEERKKILNMPTNENASVRWSANQNAPFLLEGKCEFFPPIRALGFQPHLLFFIKHHCLPFLKERCEFLPLRPKQESCATPARTRSGLILLFLCRSFLAFPLQWWNF